MNDYNAGVYLFDYARQEERLCKILGRSYFLSTASAKMI